MSLIEVGPQLCIALAPQQVALALRKGTHFIPSSAWHQACDNHEGHWQNTLALLRTGLADSKDLPANTRMHITVSSRWMQTLRLPWSDALMQPQAAQRFVQNQYVALYGEIARDWQITLDDAPYGKARLACALENSLLDALQQLAQDFQCDLASVEPLIAPAWRSAARLVGKKARALVLIEYDRICLAQIDAGRIVQIHSEYWAQATTWPTALRQCWQRACIREPHLAELNHVPVLNLSAQAHRVDVANPFHVIQLANPELAPSYAALVCQRSAWH